MLAQMYMFWASTSELAGPGDVVFTPIDMIAAEARPQGTVHWNGGYEGQFQIFFLLKIDFIYFLL